MIFTDKLIATQLLKVLYPVRRTRATAPYREIVQSNLHMHTTRLEERHSLILPPMNEPL